MARVRITSWLRDEVEKKFKKESNKVFHLMYSLQDNPRKGKLISYVQGFVIKELKYKKFRFYFITDGKIIKLVSKKELDKLIITFIGMSDKKDQQKVIDETKELLRKMRDELS